MKPRYIIGIDEVGRTASKRRASPRTKYIIGIDEVGRGCLAGPVAVAAVAVPADMRIRNPRLGKLRDSKRLSPAKRREWARFLTKKEGVRHAVARVYPKGIDRLNISRAANRAAWRAFLRLCPDGTAESHPEILLDGGLYLKRKGHVPGARTIVRGDEAVPAIQMASILAKVSRDGFMVKMARRYPGYGFDVHKGYATRSHREALRKLGPTPIHRLTFLG